MTIVTSFFSNTCLYQGIKCIPCFIPQAVSFDYGFRGQFRTHCQRPDETSPENGVSSVSSLAYEDFSQLSPSPDEDKENDNVAKVAKEVARFIKDEPEWKDKIFSEFPDLDLSNPTVFKEVLKHHGVSSSFHFYKWLESRNGHSSNPTLCKLTFRKLAKSNAVGAARAFLKETEFEPEPRDLELYIQSLCRNGCIDEAVGIIKWLRMAGYCVSLRTWNLALGSSVTARRANVTWTLHGEMIESGAETNVKTIGHLIRAFCLENNASRAYGLLRQLMDAGYFPDRAVVNELLWAFCKAGDFKRASEVLHHMIAKNRDPDIRDYHAVIHELCRRGMIRGGFLIFDELKRRGHSPDSHLYTTMIHALCREKDIDRARKLWDEMAARGTAPNEHTYNALLDGLCKNGRLNEAEKLHGEMAEKGFGKTTVAYNTMITGFCFNGKLEEARRLFDEMGSKAVPRDRITYSLMIRWFAFHDRAVDAVYFLYESLKGDVKPMTHSLVPLMRKLCEGDHIEEAKTLWGVMCEMEFRPVCLCLVPIVRGLTRRGEFGEAMEWLRYLVRNGFKAESAMAGFVEAVSSSGGDGGGGGDEFLVCSFIMRSYMLKSGFSFQHQIERPKLSSIFLS